MKDSVDECAVRLYLTRTGNGNRTAGKFLRQVLSEQIKTRTALEAVPFGDGYWVCQDPWELCCGDTVVEKYRERSRQVRSMQEISKGMRKVCRHHL